MRKVAFYSVLNHRSLDPNKDTQAFKWAFLKHAHQSRNYQWVGDHSNADITFYLDIERERMCESFLLKYWKKLSDPRAIVINCVAQPIGIVRGIYTSLERPYHSEGRTEAGFYYRSDIVGRFTLLSHTIKREHLFSFSGNCSTHPVRGLMKELFQSNPAFRDTGDIIQVAHTQGDDQLMKTLEYSMQNDIATSSFVLCPRGVASSSQRLYEVMKMGRAPVIIADDWQPPRVNQCNWQDFAIFVRENEVNRIPEILSENQSRAVEMGVRARQTWERAFSAEAGFSTLCELGDRIVCAPRCGFEGALLQLPKWKYIKLLFNSVFSKLK